MSLFTFLSNQVEGAFREYPCQFFTEHDIHSQLALFANRLLKKKVDLLAKTRDGFTVSRIHHEYPTPFRCHMKDAEFRLITEEEFREKKLENPGFRARRGYIDFVILNSEYISSNKLETVSGKRYRDFRESQNDRQNEVLDLAVEVVYFPTFDKKLREGTMNRWVSSTIQDYQKLVALMKCRSLTNIPFCKESGMMFLSNTIHKTKLEEKLESLPRRKDVEFSAILV
mgnify:CR=1 FL=1